MYRTQTGLETIYVKTLSNELIIFIIAMASDNHALEGSVFLCVKQMNLIVKPVGTNDTVNTNVT